MGLGRNGCKAGDDEFGTVKKQTPFLLCALRLEPSV